ncbi:hypothetical protein HCA44_20515, partial [Rhodococcus sp. HNM0569]|nr:hypothetical protein [Rhodococcus sp. HNM0569]
MSLLDYEDEMKSVLAAVCRQVVVAIPDADAAAVVAVGHARAGDVAGEGDSTIVVGTDPESLLLDQASRLARDARRGGAEWTKRVVRVDIERAARRRPDLAGPALAVGIRSGLSSPLDLDGTSGALILYSTRV